MHIESQKTVEWEQGRIHEFVQGGGGLKFVSFQGVLPPPPLNTPLNRNTIIIQNMILNTAMNMKNYICTQTHFN